MAIKLHSVMVREVSVELLAFISASTPGSMHPLQQEAVSYLMQYTTESFNLVLTMYAWRSSSGEAIGGISPEYSISHHDQWRRPIVCVILTMQNYSFCTGAPLCQTKENL